MSTDHETFLLLAAKDLHEGLTIDESRHLERHLAECPSCREIARGMRRDAAALGSMLTEAPVAPRVRAAVLDAAGGRRTSGARLVLALAAVLLIGILGLPILAGGPAPAPTATPSVTASPATPEPSPTPSPSSEPSASSVPSPAPSPAGSVNGAYAYSVSPGATRRDSVSARLDPGPTGEWSRMNPASGGGTSAGGPVTCLVIDGPDAWLAGPATTAPDGSVDRSAFLFVHDGGPDGTDDTAVLWMNDPGQTLATMEGWCESRFIPAGPYPLEEGDVVVRAGPE